jgi:hypothetical protein
MSTKIAAMQRELKAAKDSNDRAKIEKLQKQIETAKRELKVKYAAMKAQEKAEQAKLRAEERAADREFAEMIKREEHPMDKK